MRGIHEFELLQSSVDMAKYKFHKGMKLESRSRILLHFLVFTQFTVLGMNVVHNCRNTIVILATTIETKEEGL